MAENPSSSPDVNDDAPPTASGGGSGAAVSGRRRRPTFSVRYLLIMAGVGLFAYVFDQLTKIWVVNTMVEGEVTEVFPGVLNWHFIRNPGAAFSIGEDFTWVFTIVQATVPLIVFWLSRKLRSVWWSVAFGLLAGGALGNLTDRLFREPSFGLGHVVDFIAFPNFAIFNIADSSVVGAVILICVLTLKGIGLDGQREESDSLAASSGPGSAER